VWRPWRRLASRRMDLDDLRYAIYDRFAVAGRPPEPLEISRWTGSAAAAATALQRLHDAHAIVLAGDGTIRMALPFSAVPTGHRVIADDRTWWANCAWDTLAIPAALECDAAIEATWLDTGGPVELAVVGGELNHTDGFVHFSIPARRWWDDIVET